MASGKLQAQPPCNVFALGPAFRPAAVRIRYETLAGARAGSTMQHWCLTCCQSASVRAAAVGGSGSKRGVTTSGAAALAGGQSGACLIPHEQQQQQEQQHVSTPVSVQQRSATTAAAQPQQPREPDVTGGVLMKPQGSLPRFKAGQGVSNGRPRQDSKPQVQGPDQRQATSKAPSETQGEGFRLDATPQAHGPVPGPGQVQQQVHEPLSPSRIHVSALGSEGRARAKAHASSGDSSNVYANLPQVTAEIGECEDLGQLLGLVAEAAAAGHNQQQWQGQGLQPRQWRGRGKQQQQQRQQQERLLGQGQQGQEQQHEAQHGNDKIDGALQEEWQEQQQEQGQAQLPGSLHTPPCAPGLHLWDCICVTAALHRAAVLWRQQQQQQQQQSGSKGQRPTRQQWLREGQGPRVQQRQQQQQQGEAPQDALSGGTVDSASNTAARRHGSTSGTAVQELLTHLLPMSLACIKTAGWRELSIQLWSLAVLQHRPSVEWLEAALARGSRELGFLERSGCDERCLAVSLWALARLGCRPRKRWLKKCRQALVLHWKVSTPQHLSLALWALAKLGYAPPEQWIQGALWHVCPHMVLYPTSQAQAPGEQRQAHKEQGVAGGAQGQSERLQSRIIDQQHQHQQQAALNFGKQRLGVQGQAAAGQQLQHPQQDGRLSCFDRQGLLVRAAYNASTLLARQAVMMVKAQLQSTALSANPATAVTITSDLDATRSLWFRELRLRSLCSLQYGGLSAQQYTMLLYSLALLGFRPGDKWMGSWYSGFGALLARQALVDTAQLRVLTQALPQAAGTPAQLPKGAPAGDRRQRQGQGGRQKSGQVSRVMAVGQAQKRGQPLKGTVRKVRQAPQQLDQRQWQQVLQLVQQGHRSQQQQRLLQQQAQQKTQQQQRLQQQRAQQWRQSQGQAARGPSPQDLSLQDRPSSLLEGGALQDGGQPTKPASLVQARDVACVLWCLAKTQHTPPTWWTRLLEAVLLPRLSSFSLQELVTLLYGYGALRRQPPRLMLRALMQLLRGRASQLSPRGAADVLVALARLRHPVAAGWVRDLLRKALLGGRAALTPVPVSPGGSTGTPTANRSNGSSNPVTPASVRPDGSTGTPTVKNLSTAVASGPDHPTPSVGTRGASAQAQVVGVEAVTFQAGARMLWALGKLGIDPGPSLAQVLVQAVVPEAATIDRQALAAVEQMRLQAADSGRQQALDVGNEQAEQTTGDAAGLQGAGTAAGERGTGAGVGGEGEAGEQGTGAGVGGDGEAGEQGTGAGVGGGGEAGEGGAV